MTTREMRRVRHDTRRRRLVVDAVERLTPAMLRIDFASDDLDGFRSLSFDDHVKLFFPGSKGGSEEQMRDYTPRRFDVARGRITIDFAIHEEGVATRWALGARSGDPLVISGPRGSAIIPNDYDWYWMVGDETALPAMGRFVEEASSGQAVTTFAVVNAHEDRQALASYARWTDVWVVRGGAQDDALSLRAVMGRHGFPAGDGFIWIAAEASVARSLRGYLQDERGHPRQSLKAGGYWVRGEPDAHDKMED